MCLPKCLSPLFVNYYPFPQIVVVGLQENVEFNVGWKMCTSYKCLYILKWQMVIKGKQDHDNGKQMNALS